MAAEKRIADRKSIDTLQVNEITSLSSYTVIATEARILDASSSGFLLEISREHLSPPELKDNLSINKIVGDSVALYLPQMNLDLNGEITRTRHVGKGVYHVAITFSEDIPEYWRECLVDLLPAPGEFEYE